MDNELEEILSKAGMKKKDSAILIKLAEKRNISLGRAFFCMPVALVSLFFTPFVINLIWNVKVKVKLIGE